MFFLHRKTPPFSQSNNLHGKNNQKIEEKLFFRHKTRERVKVGPDKREREQDQEEELLVGCE
jgi:hypothetical protein